MALIERLQAAGSVYRVEDDLYFSVTADPAFGEESGFDRETMLQLFGERGGDPDRPGKKDPLDCVVWRGERRGRALLAEPVRAGPARLAHRVRRDRLAHLGPTFDVQAGGSDLVFPHHEMCAGHAQVADPGRRFARTYAHAGMVGYDGEKMSKSRGNLVFVSALRNSDVDPMAIRLALLRHHYRSDWEWTDAELWEAVDDVARWRKAIALGAGAPAGPGRRRGAGRPGRRPRRAARDRCGRRLGRGHPRHRRSRRHQRPRRRRHDAPRARRRARAAL